MQFDISSRLPGYTVSVTALQYIYTWTHLVMERAGVELATCQCAVPGLTSEGGGRSRLQPPPHPRPRRSTPFWDAQETQDKLQEWHTSSECRWAQLQAGSGAVVQHHTFRTGNVSLAVRLKFRTNVLGTQTTFKYPPSDELSSLTFKYPPQKQAVLTFKYPL